MNRVPHSSFSISVALLPANAFAQQADVDGVKAASQAYYAALGVADNGAAMEKVWAHTPYITYVGPRSKSIIVGWEPLKKMWEELNNITAERESRCVRCPYSREWQSSLGDGPGDWVGEI